MSITLSVSETFYSIQGEGACVGMPAVFLRLGGCNLRCPGFSYQDPETGEHLGCDTLAVWRKSEKMTSVQILDYWQAQGWLRHFEHGAHLVITGGEPTMHQPKLIPFLAELRQRLSAPLFVECETNATLPLLPEYIAAVTQFNASPKLSHSGESRAKAYQRAVLQQLVDCGKTKFKFVVRGATDIDEIYQDFINPLKLSSQQIWLMPEGGTRTKMQQEYAKIVELAIEHSFNFSPRLHIDIWNEATGV